MTCPICSKESTDRYRPFCSRRCSDVDLGRWLTGSYVVPGHGQDEDALSNPNLENPPRPQ